MQTALIDSYHSQDISFGFFCSFWGVGDEKKLKNFFFKSTKVSQFCSIFLKIFSKQSDTLIQGQSEVYELASQFFFCRDFSDGIIVL